MLCCQPHTIHTPFSHHSNTLHSVFSACRWRLQLVAVHSHKKRSSGNDTKSTKSQILILCVSRREQPAEANVENADDAEGRLEPNVVLHPCKVHHHSLSKVLALRRKMFQKIRCWAHFPNTCKRRLSSTSHFDLANFFWVRDCFANHDSPLPITRNAKIASLPNYFTDCP